MSQPQIGWIGLGSMGLGMSSNLQKYLSTTNHPALLYTNRTLSRGVSLQELGAIPVETVKEVASKSDIIFSCVCCPAPSLQISTTPNPFPNVLCVTDENQVSNDAVLQETTNEIIASGDIKGKIYVDCSTVHPDTSVKIAEQITAAGGLFVAGSSIPCPSPSPPLLPLLLFPFSLSPFSLFPLIPNSN